MKILLYCLNFAPELIGIGRYTGDLAEWLAGRGHEVRIVAAPPYYPQWRVAEGYSKRGYRKERVGGCLVWRCPLYVPSRPGGLKRVLHLASFALASLPVMLGQVFWRPDIVWVVEPPLFCAPIAGLVSRLAGAKCWLHVQDFEVDAAFALGLLPLPGIRRLAKAAERRVMDRFDRVSSISVAMVNRLSRSGVTSPVLFPNWSDLAAKRFEESGRARCRERLGIREDSLFCLYSGNISAKQGLEIVLDAAERLPEVQFAVCGNGAYREDLARDALQRRLENLRFLALQPEGELAAFLSAADVHLVIQRRGVADSVLPSKLTNILAVGGVAIVTADRDTELGRVAGGPEHCVFRCDPEDAWALVEAIQRLESDAGLRQRLGRNARRYAELRLDRDAVLSEFEARLQELAGKPLP